MKHNFSYESALAASSRINWKVDDIIGGDKKLDFTKPFMPESFDLITLGYWYSHHSRDDYETLYAVLRKPLREGGRIWMCDNNPPAEGSKTDSVGTDDKGNNIKARWTSDGREYHIIKNYFSEEQLRGLFEPHFAIERFVYKPYYWWMVLGEK